MEHRLSTGRFQRGRGALKGSGMQYGTRARCVCGWTTNVNIAPSKGGERQAKNLHVQHVEGTTVQGDLEALRELIAEALRRLKVYQDDGFAKSAEILQQYIDDLTVQYKADLEKLARLQAEAEPCRHYPEGALNGCEYCE